jgi:Putative zinc-finger
MIDNVNVNGTIMGRSSCDWVRTWLPLLVDDSDGLACEGSDLNAEDRRLIEQHLTACSSCRQHQAALEEAISVLRFAAADMAAGLRTPSLWPKLEERIQRHQEQSRSRWLWTLRAICPEGIRITADRFFCGCGQLRSNLPLQLAWTRDSLGDFLANRVWPVFSSRRSRLGGTFRILTPRVGFGFSLAVAGMVMLLLVVVMQRRQTQAEARIAADTAPLPSMQLPLPEMPEATEDVVTATSSSTVSRASKSLSLATSAVPAAAASMGQIATAKTASTITTATATATSAPRYDFDLEHGTPMPPETRSDKPTY